MIPLFSIRDLLEDEEKFDSFCTIRFLSYKNGVVRKEMNAFCQIRFLLSQRASIVALTTRVQDRQGSWNRSRMINIIIIRGIEVEGQPKVNHVRGYQPVNHQQNLVLWTISICFEQIYCKLVGIFWILSLTIGNQMKT